MYQRNKEGEKILDEIIAIMKNNNDSVSNLGLMTASTMLTNYLVTVTQGNTRDKANDIEVTDAMIETLGEIITYLNQTKKEIIDKHEKMINEIVKDVKNG